MRCVERQVLYLRLFCVSSQINTGIYGDSVKSQNLTAFGAQGLISCCTEADKNRVLTVLTYVSCVENTKPLGADQECQYFSEAAFCPNMKRFLLPEEL